MHWLLFSSFRVAITSLLWDWLVFFLLVGRSSAAFTWHLLVYFGHKQEMRSVWYRGGREGGQFDRKWASVMHHYSSVTVTEQMCTNSVQLYWQGVCACVCVFFSGQFCVFYKMVTICNATVINICHLRNMTITRPCVSWIWEQDMCLSKIQVYVFFGRQLWTAVVLLQGIMGEGDGQVKTSWIKGLKPGRVLCVCECMYMCAVSWAVCFAQLNFVFFGTVFGFPAVYKYGAFQVFCTVGTW